MLFFLYSLFASAALGSFLVVFIARNRPAAGSRALILLLLSATVWAIGYAMELLSPGIEFKIFWGKVQYLGIATLPLAWFFFSVGYLGIPAGLAHFERYRLALAFLPILTLMLVWSNELHGLVWTKVELATFAPFQVLKIQHGPWFWVNLIYGYVLMLAGSIRMIAGLVGSSRLRRWQISLVLAAIVIPWAANFLYAAGLTSIESLDWTPFSLIIAGLVFTLSLFRYQLVNILPIAYRAVFAGIMDCVLVLDSKDRMIDLNPAARKKLGHRSDLIIGSPFDQVAPEISRELAKNTFNGEFSIEIPWEHKFYDLHVTPLTGLAGRIYGRLVVCHEITQLIQEQTRLEKAVSERAEELNALAVRLQEVQENERRYIATELHDRIGQNLTALNLNLQIVEDQLGASCDGTLIGRLDDSIKLVEETTRQVRDVMADLHPPVLDDYGLLSALQWYCNNFSLRTGIETQVFGTEFSPRLPENVEMILFRLCQEALNNVAKHAHAARVAVTILPGDEFSSMTVKDDGLGFNPRDVSSYLGQAHWGLVSMRQRASSIGAELIIDSAPGQGTQVCIRFRRPLDEN